MLLWAIVGVSTYIAEGPKWLPDIRFGDPELRNYTTVNSIEVTPE